MSQKALPLYTHLPEKSPGVYSAWIDDINFDLIDTKSLSERGNFFTENGVYTNIPKFDKNGNLNPDYLNFWKEEKRRCLEGFTIDIGDTGQKFYITGDHYFYLNYFRIQLITKDREDIKEERIESFPRFYDGDYMFFLAVKTAEDKGLHLAVLKARGKGYSFKNASLLVRNYIFKKKSNNYALAFSKNYLIDDGILNKAWDSINFINKNTEFRQPALVDTMDKKISGYITYNENNQKIIKGKGSSITGVVCDKPGKSRGKRGLRLLFEEAGKFPNLDKAWNVARPSVEDGTYVFGILICFGTGGEEDADFSGLREIFNKPGVYRCMKFENVWSNVKGSGPCGFFVPAYVNLGGFISENGKSYREEARDYILSERRKLLEESQGDKSKIEQLIAENCLTPEEAMMQFSKNSIFPVADLNEHLSELIIKNKNDHLLHGKIVRSQYGLNFMVGTGGKPVIYYPTPDGNVEGCITILEQPFKIGKEVPDNTYVICYDPYAKDGQVVDTRGIRMSLGVSYVLKLPNPYSLTYMNLPVAWYVGRPERQDDYNENLMLLSEYYNAKIAFENIRGNIVEYCKRVGGLNRIIQTKRSINKRRNIEYGFHINKELKDKGEMLLRDWLTEVVARDEKGRELKRYKFIYDIGLLQELIHYNDKNNFDRVSSLVIGMYAMAKYSIDTKQEYLEKNENENDFLQAKAFFNI